MQTPLQRVTSALRGPYEPQGGQHIQDLVSTANELYIVVEMVASLSVFHIDVCIDCPRRRFVLTCLPLT